ncbi:hypothetical protein [Streptomyces hiroshimensis]|uniref:MarR family transcriptional regulator n=1 Tax=Streptomyces hiroshimensis TaxID=66424 RepID=A0ABQ2YDJ8_9ACTN|nr:hypothetical protein [Streptomyces hiroshimensis]GGX78845.1 hypothetical protein GCM10010324_25510 [Streptomyces hiroshimensis]
MAEANSSAAARPVQAHPQAKPGYGKRSAPDQERRTGKDFAHLPPREAQIATFIDRLPEGAAMDAKTLAAHIPNYGQAACRTALRRLSEEGHLRRVTERIEGDGGSTHWVTRTYFSRTARDDAWWADFQAGDVPRSEPRPPTQPAGKPPRSQAYEALAMAGRMDPRMTLSAADCTALEPLAEKWLARGSTPADIARELTAGLPPEVHHGAALARRRLRDKLPPELPTQPPPGRTLRMLDCTICHTPGRPEALPGGLCRDCRGEPAPYVPQAIPPAEIHRRADAIRTTLRTPARTRA